MKRVSRCRHNSFRISTQKHFNYVTTIIFTQSPKRNANDVMMHCARFQVVSLFFPPQLENYVRSNVECNGWRWVVECNRFDVNCAHFRPFGKQMFFGRSKQKLKEIYGSMRISWDCRASASAKLHRKCTRNNKMVTPNGLIFFLIKRENYFAHWNLNYCARWRGRGASKQKFKFRKLIVSFKKSFGFVSRKHWNFYFFCDERRKKLYFFSFPFAQIK